MLFHIFNSQKERREFGGSDFIEMQYCKLEQGSEIEKIVSVDAIKHWKNDSLYIFGDDLNMFYSHYGKIITGGIYNNRDSGPIDIYGINFYSRKQLALIIERVKRETSRLSNFAKLAGDRHAIHWVLYFGNMTNRNLSSLFAFASYCWRNALSKAFVGKERGEVSYDTTPL